MKKIIAIIIFLTSINSALALENNNGNFYVGTDFIYSQAIYQFRDNDYFRTVSPKNPTSSGESFGVGFNLGYKQNFGKIFIAPELFYDKPNNNTRDYYYSEGTLYHSGNNKIRTNKGLKLNLGINFEKISPFLTIGVARTETSTFFPANNDFSAIHKKNNLLIGGGFLLKLTQHLNLKLEGTYQNYTLLYPLPNDVTNPANGYNNAATPTQNISLKIAKLGLVYNF